MNKNASGLTGSEAFLLFYDDTGALRVMAAETGEAAVVPEDGDDSAAASPATVPAPAAAEPAEPASAGDDFAAASPAAKTASTLPSAAFCLCKGNYLFKQQTKATGTLSHRLVNAANGADEWKPWFEAELGDLESFALWNGKVTVPPLYLRVIPEAEHEAFQWICAYREADPLKFS